MKIRTALFACFAALAFYGCEKDNIAESRADSAFSEDSGSLFSSSGSIPNSGSGQAGDSTIQPGLLTAGEWSDLDNWAFWEALLAKSDYNEMPQYWQFGPFNRISLKAEGAGGLPLIDAPASLISASGEILWETRTDNHGKAEFFPGLFADAFLNGAKIVVEYGGQQYQAYPVKTYGQGVNELVVPVLPVSPYQADVLFAFDATGSMGDELEYIKTEINDIISRIRAENPTTAFRLGAVFYRDKNDEYLTRATPLHSNFNQAVAFINQQQAAGGGDFPEAVDEALQKAVSEQSWSTQARARLLFLILDAPPHYDDASITAIQAQLRQAAGTGIKVIPVTASGINKETEFLMRFSAITTNGTYTFITDHSGIGNDHLEPTVGDYEVEFLNDLIVRLIGKYVE
ncbi:MAG: VWA domain-containing protein [Phaeodactylibacter sp.]|nr:VWA domain-containing protein [Phaeodactylibacter sp.]MCB9274588.1 VWA domain-containing protein [Lewinellaceae bacterium]